MVNDMMRRDVAKSENVLLLSKESVSFHAIRGAFADHLCFTV